MNLLIVSFWVGQLNRYFWPGSLLGRLNLLDLAVFFAVLIFLIKKGKIVLPKWLVLFILLAIGSFGWGVAVLGWQGQPESFFYLLRLCLYVLWFGVAAALVKDKAYQWVAIIGTGVALLGFIQLLVMPSISLRLTELAGFDPHSGRLFSTFFDPNYAATVLVVTALTTLSLVLLSKNKQRRWWLISLAVQLAALLLTNSRSGLLALVVGLVIFLAAFNWRYVLLVVLTSFGLALFVPSISSRLSGALALDATSQARFASWQTALMVINEQPVLGVGYNNYQTATTILGRYQPRVGKIALAANASDSSLLTVWSTAGFFALVALIGWLLSEAAHTNQQFSLPQLMARRSVIAALLVNSWFLNSLIWPFALFLLALCLVPVKIKP